MSNTADQPKDAAAPQPDECCSTCKHSMTDNRHGFDQNDGYMDGDKLVLYGTCTYCKLCNPRLFAAPQPAPAEPPCHSPCDDPGHVHRGSGSNADEGQSHCKSPQPPQGSAIKDVQTWMLKLCDDPKTCGHEWIRGTEDGLGVCNECGERGVFTLSAAEVAAYAAHERAPLERELEARRNDAQLAHQQIDHYKESALLQLKERQATEAQVAKLERQLADADSLRVAQRKRLVSAEARNKELEQALWNILDSTNMPKEAWFHEDNFASGMVEFCKGSKLWEDAEAALAAKPEEK